MSILEYLCTPKFDNEIMMMKFKDGRWSRRIDVADFVYSNITPYEGDASFLQGPTERTKKLWDKCLEALAEERANGGVRAIDAKTISQSHLTQQDISTRTTNLS